jgi:hypothetical protein
MLNFAPSFMLLVGAYAFSNQQLFRNTVAPLDPNNIFPLYDH